MSITLECAALLVRGGAVWQLVGLITRRSQVQILPPLPNLSARPFAPAADRRRAASVRPFSLMNLAVVPSQDPLELSRLYLGAAAAERRRADEPGNSGQVPFFIKQAIRPAARYAFQRRAAIAACCWRV